MSIPSRTTSCAPPDVEPATMRTASPFDFTKLLIAGLGPMNVASMAPALRASIAAGPALKTCVVSVVSPRASSNWPPATPTSAGAWVTFAK